MLGDVRYAPAGDALVPLLVDEVARVQFFAAEALGRIGYKPAVQPLIDMLEANNEEDAYLRHAGSLALARIGESAPLVALTNHPSRALRIAAVVALRRLRHPGVAAFLSDADAYIVTEAAMAINDDLSIEEALPDLARLLTDTRFTHEPLIRRAINANLRVGNAENLKILADYAMNPQAPEALRVEAIATLGVWPKPSVLDRVDGRYRGVVERDPVLARTTVEPILGTLLSQQEPALKVAAAETAGRLGIQSAGPTLFALLKQDRSTDVKIAALKAMQKMKFEEMEPAMKIALNNRLKEVRGAALGLVPKMDLPDERKVVLMASVLGTGSVEEQQQVLAGLGDLPIVHTEKILDGQLDQLKKGRLKPEIRLDLIETIEASSSTSLKAKLDAYRASLGDKSEIAAYREALSGGNTRRGAAVFYQHEAAQCTRCHLVGKNGGDVGPELTTLGTRYSREEILESLVAPSARIAAGYGTVILTLDDGQTTSGILREETTTELILQTSEAEPLRVPKGRITRRQNAPSSMPMMGNLLSKRELRDLVEYLAGLGK